METRGVTALYFADQEKVSDYEMKLMDLDVEQLGIPVSNDSGDWWHWCGTECLPRSHQILLHNDL